MMWSKYPNKIRRARNDSDIDHELPQPIAINTVSSTLSQSNRIYFYDSINSETILDLNKQIDESAKQMQIVQITLGLESPPAIKLYINSPGGEVDAALCVADKIRSCVVPVHTYCEGEVASAATLISVSGKKRFITENSFFLIHQLSSQFWGKYAEFEDEMQNLKAMMIVIKRIYLKKTKIPEMELEELLKRDLYISPEKCLEWSVVDEII